MTTRRPPATYSETLDFLYRSLPMYQRQGKTAFKKGLGNIRALLKTLAHPQRHYPIIHIAGTNGKGSTAHILAAILQQRHYRVGLYTSPHYFDFRERIKINGERITPAGVVQLVHTLWDPIRRLNPSFFEITVAMALEWFRQRAVDVVILETGLGGRLDSTNIVRPLLSIITNIGQDHQEFLGHTLPAIAAEKAGIIKDGVPVLIGSRQPEVAAVFEQRARQRGAPLHYSESIVQCRHHGLTPALQARYAIRWAGEDERHVLSDLIPAYQSANIRTALAAAFLLKAAFNLNRKEMEGALQAVKATTGLMGRWDILRRQPVTIVDSAHNADGIRAALETLSLHRYRHLHVVFAAARDKDLPAILPLLPRRHVTYYLTRFNLPRALPVDDLMRHFRQAGLPARTAPDSESALRAARAAAHPDDLILVMGSIFLAGEILQMQKGLLPIP